MGLSAQGLSVGGGAFMRCKKIFNEKMSQNSKFASLEARVILSLTTNEIITTYDQFVTIYTVSFTFIVTPFSLKVQVRH